MPKINSEIIVGLQILTKMKNFETQIDAHKTVAWSTAEG
jgi:hypothetical protein